MSHPRRRQDPLLVAARWLVGTLGRAASDYGSWPQSEPPEQFPAGRSHAYVVADGLATSSKADGRYTPWVTVLQPELEEVNPQGFTRAFSYHKPGQAYWPRDTNVVTSEFITHVVDPYLSKIGVPSTCLAFSLAAPLFALGIAARYHRAAVPASSLNIGALVLVQPALALSADFIKALESTTGVQNILKQLSVQNDTETSQTIATQTLVALRTITPLIPVFLLYWADDQILSYDQILLAQLQAVGVYLLRLDLSFPSVLDNPFEGHAFVSSHETTRAAIKGLLLGLQL